MVGGRDYATSQVNLAVGTAGGGSGRQAGSTFKPFLLSELVKEGYSVDSTLPGPPQVDLNGNVPAQQKVFGGGSGAASAQYRQRADDLWRAQKPNELKNWQGYHPATPK